MEACYFLDLEIIVWDCGMLLGQQALVKEKSQEIWYEALTEYFNLSSLSTNYIWYFGVESCQKAMWYS